MVFSYRPLKQQEFGGRGEQKQGSRLLSFRLSGTSVNFERLSLGLSGTQSCYLLTLHHTESCFLNCFLNTAVCSSFVSL